MSGQRPAYAFLTVTVAATLLLCAAPAGAENDPEFGPYLLLPGWGDLPGGRVMLPNGTAAITFPDDWHAVALTESRKADLVASGTDTDLQLANLQVMAETIGVNPHAQCLLSELPYLDARPIEDRGQDAADAVGPGTRFELVDLAVGPAVQLWFEYPVTNPTRFEGTRSLLSTMYIVGHELRILTLVCSSFRRPLDGWRSIADTLEWLTADPSGPHIGPKPPP